MTFNSSIHRAAVLVKSLSKRQAEKLLAQLGPDELNRLSQEIGALDEVLPQEKQVAIRKFIESAARQPTSPKIGKPKTDARPFEYMANADPSICHELLVSEHPRVVATVLTWLPIRTASAILNSFDPVQRVSILRRLCRNEKLGGEELRALSHQISERMQKKLLESCYTRDSVEMASRLLSCTDISTRENLLDSLSDIEASLAADLKSRLVAFDVLLVLDDSDVKTILAHVDTSLWAPALVHCNSLIRRRIFDNLADKPSQILQNEMAQTAKVDFIVGSTAQAAIVSKILELADANLIVLQPERKRAA